METELGPFTFPEFTQSNSPLEPKTCTSEFISSLLESDDFFTSPTPAFPHQFQDLQMLENFIQTSPSSHDFQSNTSFSHLISREFTDHSYLLDLSNFPPDATAATAFVSDNDHEDNIQPLQCEASVVAESATAMEALFDGDETNCFLADDICLIASEESNRESFFGNALRSESTPPALAESFDWCLQTSDIMSGEDAQENGYHSENDEGQTEEDPKPGNFNCKNLFSERNRRKRLGQQLLALRALVPNITKMDKRSVLVDALAYLKGIHEETTVLRKELKDSSSFDSKSNHFHAERDSRTLPAPIVPRTPRKPKPQILEIDTEKIEERRFVIKITCKGGVGVAGDVLRVIESLGFEITYIALDQIKPMHLLTTIFIRVRKQGRMTEEKLKDYIRSTALRSGLILQNP